MKMNRRKFLKYSLVGAAMLGAGLAARNLLQEGEIPQETGKKLTKNFILSDSEIQQIKNDMIGSGCLDLSLDKIKYDTPAVIGGDKWIMFYDESAQVTSFYRSIFNWDNQMRDSKGTVFSWCDKTLGLQAFIHDRFSSDELELSSSEDETVKYGTRNTKEKIKEVFADYLKKNGYAVE